MEDNNKIKGEYNGKEKSSKEEENTKENVLNVITAPTPEALMEFILSGELVGRCKICKNIIHMHGRIDHKCHSNLLP